MHQVIRYLTTADGVRLAWATCGSGPALVKTANWITHLEYDWESPVWRHWVRFLAENFSTIRYDERGNGLSQHDVEDLSLERWTGDLKKVIATARPSEPFVLLGISQGSVAAINYAIMYPERISHLVLYGGYSKGWRKRDNPEHTREFNAIVELTELGWGRPEPVYRRLFTRRFLPQGTEEQLAWFDTHCARTTDPKMAARLLRSRGDADIRDMLPKVSVPTLVLHGQNDQVVPFDDGQELAAGIPGAEFVSLDSCNHILTAEEPAWNVFKQSVLNFTGVKSLPGEQGFARLSIREKEVMSGLVAGKTNVEIGASMFISEKTVRNQLTSIYQKLKVKNRTQAIVYAHKLARDIE